MNAQWSGRMHTTSTRGETPPRRQWLTYPEAAELCTLSVRSLKRLTAAGKLRCYVVGGKVLRLKASDVEALIVPADDCRGR
jgi:excisionase family DNA binding protein